MTEYEKWWRNSWDESNGLIAPTEVAKIWGLKGGAASIMPKWKKAKLKIYRFNGNKRNPYLGWDDFKKMDSDRKYLISNKTEDMQTAEESKPSN